MPSAVLYARFSPRPNAAECDSVQKQLERCKAYCTAHDYRVVAAYADEDASGGRADNRPGLQAALAAACKARAILVVYKLDRLARSTQDALAAVDRLVAAGADLASLTESVNTRSAMGKFFLTILAAFAALEREQIRERTSAAMRTYQANGRRMGRKDRVPYGKMVDPNDSARLVDCPQEQAILATMRKAAESGEGPTAIAQCLNVGGVPCRLGKKWRKAEVSKYLRRMQAAG